MDDDLPQFPHRAVASMRSADGDTVVLRAGRQRDAVTLNATALALWELCDGATAVPEMVEAVCELFSLDLEHARHDVQAALRELRASGLIT